MKKKTKQNSQLFHLHSHQREFQISDDALNDVNCKVTDFAIPQRLDHTLRKVGNISLVRIGRISSWSICKKIFQD